MKVIYIDVLLLINAILNYFLILGTCFFTKEVKKRKRFAAAAFVGSLFSLCVLLPPLNFFLAAALKLAGSVTISYMAFGAASLRVFVRNTAGLFLSSAVFAGLIAVLSAQIGKDSMLVNNFGLYIQIKPLMLVIAALIIYLILCAYELLFKRPSQISRKYTSVICINGVSENAELLADSGKNLKEPLSGKEVIILKKSYAKKILSREQLKALEAFDTHQLKSESITDCGAFSIVPFKTVSGDGLILAFKADNCSVKGSKKKKKVISEPYIGFVEEKKLPNCDGIRGIDILED
ncbi:MAG: sigma-E processing peptidase SpoIIGA [Oscillospiraceae bacterium]